VVEEAGTAEPEMILVIMTVVVMVEAGGVIMTILTTGEAAGVVGMVAVTAIAVQGGVAVMMAMMIITIVALAGASVMIRVAANQSLATHA